MEYTKGEWKVSKPFKEIPYSVSSNEKYPIARLGFTQEDEANAQLIASAPDMYEALKKFELLFPISRLAKGLPSQMMIGDAIEKARQAIAKAEGK